MFEPPPPDRFAVATLAGLVLNNLSTLLFMVRPPSSLVQLCMCACADARAVCPLCSLWCGVHAMVGAPLLITTVRLA